MNINRHNYEEFFLLYADNELSAAERVAVEVFVKDHPDLKTELEMLLQTILPSDEMRVFADKDSLFRTTDISPVNLTNYESYFVRYADDELTNEEKAATEQFVYRHPECEADFETIQRARLVPDTSIQFPDKSLLYRSQSGKRRPVIAIWMRYSAAAAIIIIAAIFWVSQTRQPISPDTGTIAITEQDKEGKSPEPIVGKQPVNGQEAGQHGIGQSSGSGLNATELAASEAVRPATRKAADISPKPSTVNREKESLLASNNHEPLRATNLEPVTKLRPVTEQTLTVPQVVAVNDKSKPEVEISQPVYVETNNTPNVVYTANTDREDIIYVGTENISRKTPVRGLLRKAGRFLEQNNPLTTERKKSGVFTASNEQE